MSCEESYLIKMSISEKGGLSKYIDSIINETGKIKITNHNGLFILEKKEG